MSDELSIGTCKTGADFESIIITLLRDCSIEASSTSKEDKGIDIVASLLLTASLRNTIYSANIGTILLVFILFKRFIQALITLGMMVLLFLFQITGSHLKQDYMQGN